MPLKGGCPARRNQAAEDGKCRYCIHHNSMTACGRTAVCQHTLPCRGSSKRKRQHLLSHSLSLHNRKISCKGSSLCCISSTPRYWPSRKSLTTSYGIHHASHGFPHHQVNKTQASALVSRNSHADWQTGSAHGQQKPLPYMTQLQVSVTGAQPVCYRAATQLQQRQHLAHIPSPSGITHSCLEAASTKTVGTRQPYSLFPSISRHCQHASSHTHQSCRVSALTVLAGDAAAVALACTALSLSELPRLQQPPHVEQLASLQLAHAPQRTGCE